MADIVGIGASVFDFLMMTGVFPAEDTKLRAKASKIQGGGPCATALVAAAKLGAGAEYFGVIGTDLYGRHMMEEFRRYGVAADSVRRVDNTVSANSVVIINTSKGSRTCVHNTGNQPPMTEDDVPLEKLSKARYLHLDGNNLKAAIYGAQKAREFGVKVSLDAGSPYPGIEELLPLADILIPSEEFVLKHSGRSSVEKGAEAIVQRYTPEIFAVTQGAKGGFIFDGGRFVRYEPFPAEVIDTNGAGDTFHGAFLVSLFRGMAPMEAARFASAVAAIKCSHFGAREGIPGYEETLRFIRGSDMSSCL
jgi:ribokinase